MPAPMSSDLRTLSDRDLLARHVAGDGGLAFGELFRRHRDRMYAVALRTTSHRELAADAVQEAFISAFRRADAYRGEAAVTTWLHRIVVNACIDRIRRERVSVRRAGDLGELDLPCLLYTISEPTRRS
jgi:RNA polymerase sigma-70 factor (ECF subfamily)